MTEINPFPNPMSGGVPPMGGGNPANRGYAPSGPNIQSGAGAIVDMILNMLASSLFSKMGGGSVPSFGRPQVSDYANMSMRNREAASTANMAAIYGSSPSSKKFGALGDNALAQQFGDMYFQSGGSRAEAFKQVNGRFSSQLSNGMPGGENVIAKKAAQVIRSMDQMFTEQNTGNWNYAETSGFNRQNTISAVAEFSSKFGGGEVIKTMSNVNSTKEQTDEAKAKITEMTEVVREAGNFFGPNMPFDQLVQEMEMLADGASGSSAASIKSALQKVQAMAVTVDMSNEAYKNYMKVIGEINKASGGHANVANLSISAMTVGKAIEEKGMEDAKKLNQVYTGPSKEEAAIDIARGIASSETSDDAINASVIMRRLSESGNSKAKAAAKLMESRDFAGVIKLYQDEAAAGNISAEEQNRITKWQENIKKNGGLSQEEIDATDAIAIKEGADKATLEANKVSGTAQARSIMKGLAKGHVFNDSRISDAAGGDKEVEKYIEAFASGKIVQNAADFEDIEKLKENVRAVNPKISDQNVEIIAEGFRQSKYKFTDKGYLDFGANLVNPEVQKKSKEIAAKQQAREKDLADNSKISALMFSDKGVLEAGAELAVDVYNDLSKDGKPVSLERFSEAFRARNGTATEKELKKHWQINNFRKDKAAAVAAEYEKRGLTPGDASIDQKTIDEIDEAATKIAAENNPEIAKEENRRKKIQKQAEKEIRGKTGLDQSDPKTKEEEDRLIEERTQKLLDEENEKLGLTEKNNDDKKSGTSEGRKDEGIKELIAALDRNTAAMGGNTDVLLRTIKSGIDSFFNIFTGNSS